VESLLFHLFIYNIFPSLESDKPSNHMMKRLERLHNLGGNYLC